MANGEKDFFNIAKMTESFRESQRIGNDLHGADSISVWQISASIAIAQQLCVMSGHLARISQALDEALERAKKS